jgi:hypothetical protein
MGVLFGYMPSAFWLESLRNESSCWASGLVGGSRSEPSTGPRGQLSESYRFLNYRKYIEWRDKVTVTLGPKARQSDRGGRDKVTVDNSLK